MVKFHGRLKGEDVYMCVCVRERQRERERERQRERERGGGVTIVERFSKNVIIKEIM